MQRNERRSAKRPCGISVRGRGPNALIALAASAFAVAAVGMAAPAGAEPTDVGPANASDYKFVQSLDKIGIPYPGPAEAVNSAVSACMQIADGHSIREAVDGVRGANPGLSLLQGAHFVAIARAVYCPGHRETY